MPDVCVGPQRSSLSASQKSSRNDYMKSGLYSTFTIQSLQVSPSSQPVKTELLLQPDPVPKVTRMPKEVRMDVCCCRLLSASCFPLPSQCSCRLLQVCVLAESKPPPPAGGGVDSSLQVIVNQPSPCRTPALSPQVPANTANQSQVRIQFILIYTASTESNNIPVDGDRERKRRRDRSTKKKNYPGNVLMASSLTYRGGQGRAGHPAR